MSEYLADSAAQEAAFALPDQSALPVMVEEPTPEPDPPQIEGQVKEFDPKYKETFTGLLYVGSLTDSFELYGHQFVITTPTQTERLQIGQVVRPYQDTMVAEIAFSTALVAAFLVSIDGKELPQPITTDPKETALQQRFQWVTDHIKRPVIAKLFDKALELDAEVDEVLDAMGKA